MILHVGSTEPSLNGFSFSFPFDFDFMVSRIGSITLKSFYFSDIKIMSLRYIWCLTAIIYSLQPAHSRVGTGGQGDCLAKFYSGEIVCKEIVGQGKLSGREIV